MDTIVAGPPEEGVHGLSLVPTSEWASSNSEEVVNNNSTFLYIAVEYVKDEYKREPIVSLAQEPEVFDFEQHVSPLDPNMSSVARYSPVYNESSTEFNPIVIHQLVQPDTTTQNDLNNLAQNTIEAMPVLCNNDIREVVENQFLQMVHQEAIAPDTSQQDLQLMPESEQEVELLITDQATGISYSVRSQEFLVEQCLEDEQLLSSLTPDPLLDSELLTLDDSTLKTELSDDIINSNVVSSSVDSAVNSYIANLTVNDLKSVIESEEQFKMETRRSQQNDVEFTDQLLSGVYSIIDKPVLSRARATLPESYLYINDLEEGVGVFAKKSIPKRTQFGPMSGILAPLDAKNIKHESSDLYFFIEDMSGIVNQLDVSDENSSNWMSFVRKAENYKEQNLVMSQEGDHLFFITTKNILPKQELKVGYSLAYANRHKLPPLSPEVDKSWSCFECVATFGSSEDLQKHLNIHDEEKDENKKPNKKSWKNKRKLTQKSCSDSLKCNNCDELFLQPAKVALRQHLIDKHFLNRCVSIDQHFSSVANFSCDSCNSIFTSEALLKIHNFTHGGDTSEEQTNHVCPSCQRKFPTQRQLVTHVATHALLKVKSPKIDTFKCPVCHKIFALQERLRRHMLVHGSDESKPLQCKTCNKRFLNNSALAGHLKTHVVGVKVFECPICKESFDHVLKLKLHVPQHCENNVFACPHCNKVFKKYSIIRKHIRAFHCDQKHSCPHCSKLFPTVDKLKMHMLRHSDHREFLCADCGKQFKRKDKLKEHCKRMHSEERENDAPRPQKSTTPPAKKLSPTKVEPTDFHRFIYKCHTCLVGFKRRGMLVNHLAKRHPDVSPDSVPELNLPILQTTRDYYCQHCDKVYKSSSKRKAHILKNHPGAALPMSNRKQGTYPDGSGLPNPTFSQTVGSITTRPQNCKWCHKQYASKAKLLQHQRKKHTDQLKQQHLTEDKCDDLDDHTHDSVEEANLEDSALDEDFKVTESDILNANIDDKEFFTSREREDEQFCHLVTIADNGTFGDCNELNAPNSHLYRLLTTSSGMVPPR